MRGVRGECEGEEGGGGGGWMFCCQPLTLMTDVQASISWLLFICDPCGTSHSTRTDAVLMLGQRRRRWHNIKTALVLHFLFPGFTHKKCGGAVTSSY